jgi:YD repeat-containing protein
MDYDSRGFVVTQIRWDGQEHKTVMDYDNRGRVIHTIAKGTPDLTTFYAYDGVGRRTLVTDPSNRQTYNEYDLMGHLTKMVEDYGGLNRQTDYVYDQQGRLWQQVAHNNDAQNPTQTTVYGYDANGQQATITYPDNGVLAFEFYPNGAVSRRIDQRNQADPTKGILNYTYDMRGLLLNKSDPDDTSYLVRYDYDGAGRMVTAKMGPDDQNGRPESQIVYTYDGLNRLLSEQQKTSSSQPEPRNVFSEYDQAGNRTLLTYPQ